MDIHRARQAVEKKDEQLDASRRILEAQEDELFVSVLTTSNSVVQNAKLIWSSFDIVHNQKSLMPFFHPDQAFQLFMVFFAMEFTSPED